MLKDRSTHVRYVFLDVVDFTKRNTDDQTRIVRALNEIVRAAVTEHGLPEGEEHLLFLPTGDGICIALKGIDTIEPRPVSAYDLHLRLALSILRGVHEHGQAGDPEKPPFAVRVGVNEDEDNEFTDITGRPNVAGAGINHAQRIMSLAESNQIMLGEMAYRKLIEREYKERHEEVFCSFDATVKHGVTVRAHQYVAEGHPGLNTDRRDAQRKGDVTNSIRAARECGLRRVYHSRGEESFREAFLRDVDAAGERIWLLAACLSEKIDFRADLLPRLERKIKEVDVRILLLDALRSPAVFRTFLESDSRHFRNIIKPSYAQISPTDVYSQQPLFRSFHDRYYDLVDSPVDFGPAVRFYGHTPLCWLAVVDGTAYFQPYTFGGNMDATGPKTIGPLMPVFKFERAGGGRTPTFDILEDHFNKLWLTSDEDLFHIGARLANKEMILKRTLKRRGDWLNYSYDALYAHPSRDRRAHPRRRCESKPPPSPTVEWEDAGQIRKLATEIVEFSCVSIRLKVKPDVRAERAGEALPPVGSVVTLDIPRPVGEDYTAAAHLRNGLILPSSGKFRVVRAEAQAHLLTLRAEVPPQQQAA